MTPEHFSTWLRRTGRTLPSELAHLVPPEGLTFGATIAWARNELYRLREIPHPQNLLTMLGDALRALQVEHSAETGLPVVEGVEVSLMAVPERSALRGLLFGDGK